jgi:hypothetical protein
MAFNRVFDEDLFAKFVKLTTVFMPVRGKSIARLQQCISSLAKCSAITPVKLKKYTISV